MVGRGGAVLAVPALVYVVGLGVHAATTVSLAVVAGVAATGAIGQVFIGFRTHTFLEIRTVQLGTGHATGLAKTLAMSTNRVEAFSDGVFAIAITLLVLQIHVPAPGSGEHLARALAAQWPSYAAYAISFLTIGIIWINHHVMIRRLRIVDHSVLIWNLLLLMCVGALPFTTALMAAYLKGSQGEALAAAVYSGSFLVMSLVFAATNHHILFRRAEMLADEVDERTRHLTLKRGIAGVLPYLVATVLAFVSPYLTFAVCAAVAVFYALPFATASDSPSAAAG